VDMLSNADTCARPIMQFIVDYVWSRILKMSDIRTSELVSAAYFTLHFRTVFQMLDVLLCNVLKLVCCYTLDSCAKAEAETTEQLWFGEL
jgi:hypothetical protein